METSSNNYSELSLNGHLPKTDIAFGPGHLYIISQ